MYCADTGRMCMHPRMCIIHVFPLWLVLIRILPHRLLLIRALLYLLALVVSCTPWDAAADHQHGSPAPIDSMVASVVQPGLCCASGHRMAQG